MKLHELYDSSPEYQNYKVRNITANQNRVNNASRTASQAATMAAHSNHTTPIYATQGEWDNWLRMGGIEYARQMDLDRMNDPRAKQFQAKVKQQQSYVQSQLQRSQNTHEAYDPRDPDSWMDDTNRKNAQYAQTHYSQPADDTMTTDGTFSDSAAYANHRDRTRTAQQNRANFAKQNAEYKANMSANSQHTSPMYSTQEEWDKWVRDVDLHYAQGRDLENLKKQQLAKFNVEYEERQAYIRALKQMHQPPPTQNSYQNNRQFSPLFRQQLQQRNIRK